MSKTLLDSEGLKLYDRLIKEYIANNAGGGSGDAIPKIGDRGTLAGFDSFDNGLDWEGLLGGAGVPPTLTVNASSNDVSFAPAEVVVENGDSIGLVDYMLSFSTGETVPAPARHSTSWTKVVFLMGGNTVTMGSHWVWSMNEVPSLANGGVLVLHWNSDLGVACYIDMADGLGAVMENVLYEWMNGGQ